MNDQDKALVNRLRYDCHLAMQLGDDARIVLAATDARTIISRIESQAAKIEQLRKALKALYFDDYYGIWDNLSANGCCHGFKPAKRCPNEGCRHGELQTNIEAALGDEK